MDVFYSSHRKALTICSIPFPAPRQGTEWYKPRHESSSPVVPSRLGMLQMESLSDSCKAGQCLCVDQLRNTKRPWSLWVLKKMRMDHNIVPPKHQNGRCQKNNLNFICHDSEQVLSSWHLLGSRLGFKTLLFQYPLSGWLIEIPVVDYCNPESLKQLCSISCRISILIKPN